MSQVFDTNNQPSIPLTITTAEVFNRIYTIRGVRVMLDSDLAEFYGYDVRSFNQQVRRNISRFPSDFMFELTNEEVSLVKSQIVTSRPSNFFAGQEGGRRKPPLAFTEQGIYMLASVLHGEIAEKQSILIMRAFRAMRQFLADNALVFQRLDWIEIKQIDSDHRINMLYDILQSPKPDKAVIFFRGQMWDATSCIEEIIGKAEKSIILIDSYVDKGTLDMLSRKKTGATISIYTNQKSCKLTGKEISAFRSQYGELEIIYTDDFHDRFLILDKKELYHIGASIKDAGKKTFEISMNDDEKMLSALLSKL